MPDAELKVAAEVANGKGGIIEFIYNLTILLNLLFDDLRFTIYLRFKAQRRLFVFSTQRRGGAKIF